MTFMAKPQTRAHYNPGAAPGCPGEQLFLNNLEGSQTDLCCLFFGCFFGIPLVEVVVMGVWSGLR